MPKNTGGDHVVFLASASDATGFAIAPAAAATPEVVKSATLLLEDENTSGGGLTYSTSTGKVSVATPAGIGKYLCRITAGDTVGQNGKYHTLQAYAVEGGEAVAAVGSKVKKEEPATAVRSAVGSVECIVNLSAVGDTVEPRLGVETNADSITIHDFTFSLVKIGEV